MARPLDRKIILVTRRTRLDELVDRFNTVEQARFYIEHLGVDFGEYEDEHKQYTSAVIALEQVLRNWGIFHRIDRSFLPTYLFGPDDFVVVLGQDGLVANTLKYLDGHPVVGVNPDIKRWEGVLLPFGVADVQKVMPDVIQKKRPIKQISMAKTVLNNGQVLYGVNDLFIGPRTHFSARYVIEIDGKTENHSSSGIIVSTGLGSTGWLKSIIAGSFGIVHGFGDRTMPPKLDVNFPWDADYLHFSVREPFPSKTTTANIVFGKIELQQPLKIVSQMPGNGVIFSDGIEDDFLEFNSGISAEISVADKKGVLVF